MIDKQTRKRLNKLIKTLQQRANINDADAARATEEQTAAESEGAARGYDNAVYYIHDAFPELEEKAEA